MLALSLGMLAITQNALSAPGDIFVMPAPAIGSPAPKGADIKVGEASVATQTGALQWAYPIAVPPGRHGAVPTLSIAYTSQGSIYGTLAAGFTLAGVPEIREDTSLGRLRTRSDTDKANDRFTSSLAGNMRLVKVSLPAASDVYGVYRAQGDTTAAQYERMIQAQAYYWRVRHTDGSEMYFGEATHGCSNLMRESYAPLTTFRDVFGNEVSYEYEEGAPYECRLKRITWGQNANAGLNQPFAKVELAYSGAVSCGPAGGGGGPSIWVGAQLDFRTGKRIVTGASKLLQITATAFAFGGEATPSHTRVITLDYFEDKESCATTHSPVRLLRSIQESAWGTAAPRVDLPPITFEYGTPAIALTSENTIPFAKLWSGESLPFNFGWGRRAPASAQDKWPSVEAMMIDMNGDGLPDRLANASIPEGDGQCKARWARNEGPSAPALMFSVAGQITLPRLRWRGSGTPVATGAPSADAQSPHFESCALNGQATAYRNVINGSQVNCHPGSVPGYSETQFLPFVQFCYGPGEFGLEHPTAAGVDGEFRTYLGYRWMDVTGDGLTDLVAAVQGNITGYDIVVGNDTFFTSDPAPFGAWPTCPQIDRCKKLDADCLDHAVDQASMDICIANAPSAPCGDLTTSVYSMPGQPISPPAPERTPYQRCEGLYPWFIYENQSNGTFLPMPRIIYSPVELESSTGESPAFAPFVVSKDHAIMDIDGDGIIDAAKLDEAGKNWQIWLGDGTGAFEPRRYVFSRLPRPSYQFFAMNSTSYYGQASSNGEGLIDLNGDGLPEHWSVNPSGANVAFHDGTGFEVSPIDAYGKCYGPCSGAMQLPMMPADATGYTNLAFENGRIISGSSVATKRVVDVDADGRVDVVDLVPTPAQVYFNLGGQLRSTTANYAGDSLGLQRKVDAFPEDQDNTWEVTADLIDLNGDGIMESASFATGGLEQHEHVYGASPPRLLTRIENGRGAVTVVSYSSMHDENAVKQNPSLHWPDGRPMASPNNQWVVRALATHDSFSSTTSTTSHFYKNPRHGKNDEGRYGFRGFEEVEVTAPSGAKTVSRYDYQVDWSGRLVETRVQPAEALGDVRSIDRTEWTGRQSFGGAITTYHATLRKQYTCKNDQTSEACLNEPAGATYTAIAQTPFDVGGLTILWQDTETTLQAGLTVADGDRRTWSKYTLVRDTTHYRFRQIDTTREQRANGSWVMFGKSASSWDSDFKVQLTNEVWVDADDSHTAITRFVYDMATGNVLQRFKPVQNAESGPAAGYTYDSRKLFVVTETNELGHVRDLEYEYGTGTKLSTSGPNPAYCPGNCPPGMTCMPKERHAIVVDGLGRETQQWDTTGGPCTFPYVQRTETTYFDGTSSSAGWTRHRRRIDVNQSTWTDEKTELDGHGRPTKKTVFVQGSAPADQITTFTYENDGTLSRVEVPDPSVNTVARVAYTYTYDSLGRATSVRRPDATADIDKSGVDISYDGLTQTTSEVVGAAGGNPAVTKIVKDRFGRLVEVHEQLTPSPATWATTLYTYAPDDNVRTVTDPETVTSELEHDFAGRRTAITRSGRTWKYTYDRNGNMKSELVPGADDLLDEINFKTFIDYDALDRPISKLVGQRHLSAPDQAAFGGNTESFLWDYGGNMIGYLRRWQSFAPNNPTPLLKVDAFVDSLGLQESTTQVFNVAGYSNLQRKFFQNYNVMGAVKQAWYYDEFTYSDCNSADCTNAVFVYDARGLPSQIQLSDSAGPVKTIGNQTRNVAGLVTKRRTTPPPGGPMTYVESNWTYDRPARSCDWTSRAEGSRTRLDRPPRSGVPRERRPFLAHAMARVIEPGTRIHL
jgi:YD repeat-containing protein